MASERALKATREIEDKVGLTFTLGHGIVEIIDRHISEKTEAPMPPSVTVPASEKMCGECLPEVTPGEFYRMWQGQRIRFCPTHADLAERLRQAEARIKFRDAIGFVAGQRIEELKRENADLAERLEKAENEAQTCREQEGNAAYAIKKLEERIAELERLQAIALSAAQAQANRIAELGRESQHRLDSLRDLKASFDKAEVRRLTAQLALGPCGKHPRACREERRVVVTATWKLHPFHKTPQYIGARGKIGEERRTINLGGHCTACAEIERLGTEWRIYFAKEREIATRLAITEGNRQLWEEVRNALEEKGAANGT